STSGIRSRSRIFDEANLLAFACDDNRRGREGLKRGQVFSIRHQREAFVRGPHAAELIVAVDKTRSRVGAAAERRQLASIRNQRFAKSGVEGNRVYVVPI